MQPFDPNNMTPEQQAAMAKLFELGALDDENSDLDAQIAQAQALRDPSVYQHSSPWGALLGGVAGAINTLNSNRLEKGYRTRKDENRKKATEGRGTYADALYGRGLFAQPSAPPLVEAQATQPSEWADPYASGGDGGLPYGYSPGMWKRLK